MTREEQTLVDDRVRAEIANLNAMTAKAMAEIEKMRVETMKIGRERALYPLVVGAGAMGAAVAIARFLFI